MKKSAKYMLAPSEEVANAYVQAQGVHTLPFGWPTVMGWMDDEPIGLLGTLKKEGVILAGPLVVSGARNTGPTVLRLIDAYEVVMRMAGVTQYNFAVEENHPFANMITRVSGDRPHSVGDGYLFFTRMVA